MIVDILSPWHVSSNGIGQIRRSHLIQILTFSIFWTIYITLLLLWHCLRQNVHKWHSGNYNCRNNLKADIFTLFYYSQLPWHSPRKHRHNCKWQLSEELGDSDLLLFVISFSTLSFSVSSLMFNINLLRVI